MIFWEAENKKSLSITEVETGTARNSSENY